MSPIKIILVDDHPVVRAGYRLLLETAPEIQVIAEFGSGEEAYHKFSELNPAVVIMDLSMPGMGGLETIRRMMTRYPDAKILVFTMHDSSIIAEHALQAGAMGFITKSSAPNTLVSAVKKIAGGESYVDRAVADHSPHVKSVNKQAPFSNLSNREFQILCLCAEGSSVQEIASRLSLSAKTVSNYLTQIKEKAKVTSTAQLVRLALQHNIASV